MQDIFGSSPKDIHNKHVYQKAIHQHQPLISFLIVHQGDCRFSHRGRVVPLKAKVSYRWRKLCSPVFPISNSGTLLRNGVRGARLGGDPIQMSASTISRPNFPVPGSGTSLVPVKGNVFTCRRGPETANLTFSAFVTISGFIIRSLWIVSSLKTQNL